MKRCAKENGDVQKNVSVNSYLKQLHSVKPNGCDIHSLIKSLSFAFFRNALSRTDGRVGVEHLNGNSARNLAVPDISRIAYLKHYDIRVGHVAVIQGFTASDERSVLVRQELNVFIFCH